jgi:hypothetical protein
MTDRKKRNVDPQTTPGSVDAGATEQKSAPPGRKPPRRYPDPVDDALDGSFPASDPPPWWGR